MLLCEHQAHFQALEFPQEFQFEHLLPGHDLDQRDHEHADDDTERPVHIALHVCGIEILDREIDQQQKHNQPKRIHVVHHPCLFALEAHAYQFEQSGASVQLCDNLLIFLCQSLADFFRQYLAY